MADQTNNTPKRSNGNVEDPNFIFGDKQPQQKIDAWEGEGEIDLVSDAGEMSLANLHFGSTEEADFTKTGADNDAAETAGKPVDGIAIDDAVSVDVLENDAGAIIGSLTSFDSTTGDGFSYSVSDDRFEIVNGDLRLVEGVSLDFEDAASLDVIVTGSDKDGNTVTEAFAIDVIDVNDAPTDLELNGNTVAENEAGAVIGTLSAFDPDADDTLTYTVSDDRFEVVDGELRLADGVSLNHEEAASIEVTVTATDSGGLDVTETFTIDVADVNEGPTDLALDGNTVAENDAGATVGTLTSFDPDAGDTVTYTVSDDRFEVVDGELRLAEGVSLNHEEAASIEVTVTATDSAGLSTEEAFTIDVADVNEGPTDLALDGNTVAENDAGATVGTLSSFDPDAGDTVTYTVSDDRFEVVDGELRLADGVSLNHEEAASIEVTVTATDSEGAATQEAFTVEVADVNEGPTDLALDGNTVSENDAGATVGTLSSFDPDAGDTVTYTVSDDRFEVVDGELRLAEGVSLNHEEAASIEVTVTATDSEGAATQEAFTIDVADVNEGPTDLALDGNTVAENDAGATVGTLSSFDPDAGDTVTYTVSDDRFEVVDGELRLAEGVSLNHEEAASIEVTVTATDSEGASTQEAFTIDVADVNEGPSDLALDGNTVSENDAGATIGTLSSFDPDAGDTVTYTVSDDRFEVVDGELRLAEGVSLNHEEAASIEVTVTATDSEGASTQEAFTIDVADVNEGPSDLALDGNTVSENDAGATIGTLSSFDPDAGDTVTYTVSDDRFEVVDGELRLAEGVSLNHEEAASIEVTITATDSEGASTQEDFTIDVADVNEGPSDLALDGNSVSENDAGATVGTLSSFDPDAGDSVTYTVSDDRFEVVDGELRLAEGVSLNHEEAASIEVTVTATDSEGASTQEDFTIDVADVNEGPSDLALDGNSVSENDAGATVGTLSSFDPDAGDTVTYTVSDDRFEVVDGELRLAEGVSLNHEEAASIEVTVTATDSEGAATQEAFTIDVTDVNEGPTDLSLDGNTVAENDEGATVGTLSSFDPDAGDTVTYTVSDDRFEVVDGELRLADGVSLNHEEAASIEVTVTATDSEGASTQEAFTIDVTDVNEGPTDLSLDGNTVAENDAGATVGTLSSFDPDAGDTVTYTVSDDRFEVVDGELRLAEGVSLNHEEAESIEVTVTATDSGGLDVAETFTIDVADVNEGPSDLALARETGLAESDFSASDGHSGSSIQQMGLESDAIVFTMSFTTADDVSSTQTLFETGGSVYGTNVVIEDGMLLIYAGEGNDLELSIPINGDTEYSFALELDTENDTIRVLLSDELPLEEMTAENSLVASLDDWTDRDYTGSNQMGVGDEAGGSSQGRIGGDFQGEIAEPGVQVFSNSSLDDVFTEVGVAENTEGVVVGTLSSFDPDAGDTITYTVSDDRFEVVDGEVRLAEGVTLDYEEASSIELTITATDSGGLSTSETFTVDVVDLNEGPTDLSMDPASIDENSTEGVIGTVSVTDPDAGDTHTFSLVDNEGQPFAIDAETGEISLISPGVPEGSVLHIDASATDSLTEDGGVSAVQDLSQTDVAIGQSDSDQRPEFTNDGPFGGPGLQFDGENDRLDIADDSAINLSSQSERSFAMTIQTGEDVESRQVIYEEGGTVNGFNFYIDDGQLYMGAWSESTGWDFQAISMEVEPGESYSIVTVFDGDSNSYTAYVNGEEVGSIEVGDTMSGHSGNIGLGGISQHTEFHDGQSSANEGFYFEGSVGDFVVYNEALDSADVTAIDMDFRGIDPAIDFETQDSYDLTVQVTDAAGETYEEVVTIDVNDLNEGPLDLTLEGNSVAENDAGATVGTLSSFDPDAGDTVTYTVSDDRFEVVDGELRLAEGVSLNHEEAASIEVTVTATDGDGQFIQEAFTIDVADVNEEPSDLALDGNSVSENDAGATVGTLSSFDPDAGDTVTYTVSDDRFEVVDGELRLAEGVSLNHEEAASIEVTVTATDSEGASTQEAFTIDVADVNEGPTDLALDGNTVAENDAGATVGTLSSFDPDAGDTVTYTVSDDRFEVVDGELRLAEGISLNHEEAASIEVTVTATDSEGASTQEAFTIDVTDVNEGPSDIALDGNTVNENDAGATIGTLSSFDPDAGDTVTYTVSDDRFEVVEGEVRLVEGVSLDREEASSLDITVTATDESGASTSETFTITVEDIIEGTEGDDRLAGTAADDTIESYAGDDRAYGGDGNDTVHGGEGNDVIHGQDGDDTLNGDEGNDRVSGGDGNDVINGGDGNDVIVGGEGADELSGGDGNDTIYVDGADTVINGGDGEDRVVIRDDNGVDIDMVDTEVERVDGGNGDDTIDATGAEDGVIQVGNGGDDVITGGDGDDRQYGGGDNDTIEGGAGNDNMHGQDGNDTLDGGDGNDRVNGGNGDDVINGGDGNDVIVGGEGADELSGGDGNDTIYVDGADTVINGGDGEDRVIIRDDNGVDIDMVDSEVERVDGGNGGDTIDATGAEDGVIQVGNGGDDVITGGDGDDRQYGGADNDTISGGAGNDNMHGQDGNDTLDGGDGNDRVNGGNGDDVLNGGDGNDVIVGGEGADELHGGDGNDTIYMDGNDTAVTGGDGEDRVIIRDDNGAEIDMTAAEVERVDGGNGDDTIDATGAEDGVIQVGNGGDDVITGGDGDDRQYGGADNDTISGGAGNDNMHGQDGNDTLDGGEGNDRINGGTGDDVIHGGDGNDVIVGGEGADELHGGDGNDTIYMDGNDTAVTGGDGQDRVIIRDDNGAEIDMAAGEIERVDGGNGDDTIDATGAEDGVIQVGNGGDDILTGGDGDDRQYGGADNDTISGGAGNDYLHGQDGNDTLNGGEGDDRLNGGTGDDILSGGEGNDVLVGGEGNDTAVFDGNRSDYTVTEISPGRFTVTDHRADGEDGQDTVIDVENFQFADGTFEATEVANDAPRDLELDGSSVAENAEGAVVGTVSSYDPDAGDSVTYTVSDDRFEVVDGELRLAEGVSLDHEEADSIEVTITATDNDGLSTQEAFTIDVTDVNEGPSDLVLETSSENLISGGSFEEQNVASGRWAGFGDDASGNWDSANGIEVWDNLWGTEAADGNQFLELDYTSAADAISQTVSTEAGQVYTLSLDVRARSEGADTDSIEVYWNGELIDVVDPSSTDWETVTFDVVGTGGEDVLEFREVEDQSNGLGAHMDNISLIEVPMTLAENVEGAVVGSVSAFDPDAGDALTFTVSDDRFEVVDGDLRLVEGVSLDHEEAASIELEVTATDSDGASTTESFTINVADVNDAPETVTIEAEAKVSAEAATVTEGDITLGNGGGSATSTVALNGDVEGSSEIVIEFGSIDNSFQIEVNGQSLSDETIQLQENVFNDDSEVMLVFEDGTPAASPWVPNSDGSPRFQVVVTEDGVEIYGTRNPGSGEMEPMSLQGGSFNDIDLVSGDNSVTIINPDGHGPDGLSATVSGQYEVLTDGLSVTENVEGEVVGTLSSFDQDAGDTITYTVSDDRFEIVDGDLKLAEGESLDYEAEQSVEVTVTATDSDGAETAESFTIEVNDVADTDGGVTVKGSDGDDTLKGGTGNDEIFGGEGDDLFIYEADGGSDSFDGGAGWTDTIDLSNALGDDAVYGDDWTVVLTDGEIVNENAESLELTDDAAGFIELDNGETIDFSNVEQIGF